MSNETKRDVFDDAVFHAGKSLYMLHDIDYAESILDGLNNRYAAALPDDLPVIPMAAGDEIEIAKMRGKSIVELLEPLYSTDTLKTSQSVTGVWTWAVDHSDTFARAWLLGVWRVEETGEIVKLEAEVRDEN